MIVFALACVVVVSLVDHFALDQDSTTERTTAGSTQGLTTGSTAEPVDFKILALHGGGESSQSFRNQAGMVDLGNELVECTFVFGDAPEAGGV